MADLKLIVASWDDRDDLVVEIESGDEDFGLVSVDPRDGRLTLEIYPRPSGEGWRFDLDRVREVLNSASQELSAAPVPSTVE